MSSRGFVHKDLNQNHVVPVEVMTVTDLQNSAKAACLNYSRKMEVYSTLSSTCFLWCWQHPADKKILSPIT